MTDTKGFKGHLITVLLTIALGIGVFIWLLDLSGAISLGGSYKVKAIVPEAGSLTQGSSVTMAGIRVGIVSSVKRQGDGALVDLSITDHDIKSIPKDSTVTLRERTPLGENYVEIDPGKSKQKLPSGQVITMNQTNPYVDVDQILSTLQGDTRAKTEQTIQSLGGALKGRGDDLNQTLHSTADLLVSGSDITKTLHPERAQLAQLIRQLGDVSTSVGQRQAAIEQIATQGLTTLKAVSAQNSSLSSFLDGLPSTLDQVKQTTGLLGTVSGTATPVIANLATAVTRLRPAIKDLGPAAREGKTVVQAAANASKPLSTTLKSVSTLSPKLTPAIKPLTQAVCQVNPMLRYIKPYTRDLLNFVQLFGYSVDSYDNIGHTIRLLPVEQGSTSIAALPTSIEQAENALINEGFLEKTTGVSVNSYPGPGQANASLSGGLYQTPKEWADSTGYKYPHITSDC